MNETTSGDSAYHFYETVGKHGLARDPLKAIIAPRPIAWVSSLSVAGVANLAPYSFFNMVSDTPPMLMFSSMGYKDSVSNIAETREFTVSFASRPLANAMNVTSAPHPPEVDEFQVACLDRLPSRLIAPPGVAGSPAVLECRSADIRQLHDCQGNLIDTWMIVGQIVAVHIATNCLSEGRFRTEKAQMILRAGYSDEYWEITEEGKFAMARPR